MRERRTRTRAIDRRSPSPPMPAAASQRPIRAPGVRVRDSDTLRSLTPMTDDPTSLSLWAAYLRSGHTPAHQTPSRSSILSHLIFCHICMISTLTIYSTTCICDQSVTESAGRRRRSRRPSSRVAVAADCGHYDGGTWQCQASTTACALAARRAPRAGESRDSTLSETLTVRRLSD